jgi:hypothetical protein
MERHEVTLRKLVYGLQGTDAVTVRRDMTYRASHGRDLVFDFYRSLASTRTAVPAVLFVTGFPDPGMRRMVGCNAKDITSNEDWARLVAASGLAAITYVNHDPVADAHAILEYLREHSDALSIEAERIGVWASSGNVPNALSLLMTASPTLTCGVFCYGYMLDLGGSSGVADAAATWRFTNPCAGHLVEDLPDDLPLFIARAGRDEMPGLNDSIDRFAARALALNRPVTVVNHHTGPHVFDTVDPSAASRRLIRQILAFLTDNLRVT